MPSKTTKLEAVNTVLSTVGSSPVNALTGAQSADTRMAISTLDEVSREIQSVGWHFNTEDDMVLAPDATTSEIVLGDNVVRCDLSEYNTGNMDIVQRGNRLYDRVGHTYAFVNPLKATLVMLMDWDELPEPARRYITIRASRIFQDRMVGSQVHHQYTALDEFQARAALIEFEGDTADHSIFDNWSVGRILYRRF